MYAKLPKGAKPSRSVSKDDARPMLTSAELVCIDEGEKKDPASAKWELQTTDSYQLVRLPVTVHMDEGPELTPGPISSDALKAIEKPGAGAFYANGSIEVLSADFGGKLGQTFAREPRAGSFPNVDQLMPDAPANELTLCFDPRKLEQVVKALGAGGTSKNGRPITITIDLANVQAGRHLRPLVIRAAHEPEAVALLMPVRHP